ncbi:MAG: Ig-like domain-containing protein [Bacteroides sp.]|nr:Ig-like domain-containing protein [Roseburia sp.]MCM1347628.1 Ig-like domain-containing protein [Bacteroides sp.]MCM1422054.1 Ig-like domain-containing protein [Bacteroides sp.]
MRKYWNFMMLPLMVMAMLVCASCGDDDDNESGGPSYKTNILGEWYADKSSSDKKIKTIINYEPNGKYDFQTIISSLDEGLNEKFCVSSTYSLNGNVLKETMDYGDGSLPVTETYNITSINDYTMVLAYEKTNDIEVYHRVIGTYSLTVGNTLSFYASSIGFTPTSFTSADPHIATISNDGKITAVKRGMAYITAWSGTDAAVIRVNVKDGNKVTDDYSDMLDLSKEKVKAQMGDKYLALDNGLTFVYYVGDWDIKEIDFYFTESGRVESVVVEYWQDVDMNAIDESFKQEYSFLGTDENTDFFYGSNASFEYLISLEKEVHSIFYKKNQSEFEYFDSFKNMKADEIAAAVGYTLTDEDAGLFSKAYNGDYFDLISVMYETETKNMEMIQIRCTENVALEDVEPWYKENYPFYVDGLGYCEREDWWNMSPITFVKVSVNSRNGRTYVNYSNF